MRVRRLKKGYVYVAATGGDLYFLTPTGFKYAPKSALNISYYRWYRDADRQVTTKVLKIFKKDEKYLKDMLALKLYVLKNKNRFKWALSAE